MSTIKIFSIFPATALLVPGLCLTMACNKIVQVSPPSTSLVSETVYSNSATASSAVVGIYQQMASSTGAFFFGSGSNAIYSFSTMAGLSADEFQDLPTANALLTQAYENVLPSTNPSLGAWSSLYNIVYLSNAAIQGLTGSSGIPTALKNQLMGAALFSRAFCHFYLTNIYGDVPLVTGTNYQVNAVIARTPRQQVYAQVIADLQQAQGLLSNNYLSPSGNPTAERTLPNQYAATALLARVYLYTQKYDSAVIEASQVINDSMQYQLLALNKVFLKNSLEAIWQIPPTTPGYNSPDGYTYLLTAGPNTSLHPVYLTPWLLNAFEPGDSRDTAWVKVYAKGTAKYYYPDKYKLGYTNGVPPAEYQMVMRLAEQYLIRAEAETQGAGGGLPAAINDLNRIRSRAGLAGYAGAPGDATAVLAAVMHERQVELFTEWGHRWLDLKRTGAVDSVMTGITPQKRNSVWKTTAQLFPILQTELQSDPNLHQNPGY